MNTAGTNSYVPQLYFLQLAQTIFSAGMLLEFFPAQTLIMAVAKDSKIEYLHFLRALCEHF